MYDFGSSRSQAAQGDQIYKTSPPPPLHSSAGLGTDSGGNEPYRYSLKYEADA